MPPLAFLKEMCGRALIATGCDRLGRAVNRHRIPVIMYHGITETRHADPIWTQVPVESFRQQLEFLNAHYRFLTLSQFVAIAAGEEATPERSVLITFDDGLRNNCTVAFPILRAMGIPAAVFLTTDLIGTEALVWTDELYLLLREKARQGRLERGDVRDGGAPSVWPIYLTMVEQLKLLPQPERQRRLDALRADLPLACSLREEDFRMLGWEEVSAMAASGLIEFGVHTASHQILTTIGPEAETREVVMPKKMLEERLGARVDSFCYPNGRRGLDFAPRHELLLRRLGYRCAFATDHGLFTPGENPFAVQRVAVGNDQSAQPVLFRLATAGII